MNHFLHSPQINSSFYYLSTLRFLLRWHYNWLKTDWEKDLHTMWWMKCLNNLLKLCNNKRLSTHLFWIACANVVSISFHSYAEIAHCVSRCQCNFDADRRTAFASCVPQGCNHFLAVDLLETLEISSLTDCPSECFVFVIPPSHCLSYVLIKKNNKSMLK